MSPAQRSLQLARRLISEEGGKRHATVADASGHAAFRVCEKIRTPLSTLTGAGGYRALLSRALALAGKEAVWLGRLEVTPAGSLRFPPEVEAGVGDGDAAQSGVLLVAELLGLLITMIGEALTLRLLQEIWPKTPLGD